MSNLGLTGPMVVSNEKEEIRCIRVTNTETGERVLINSEGYDYCRYTALEE